MFKILTNYSCKNMEVQLTRRDLGCKSCKFSSRLAVIDVAFDYLLIKAKKGDAAAEFRRHRFTFKIRSCWFQI